jgi:LacI family transcriptional regulator
MVDPARRRRATVRDVAEKAGVSISTVSLAFHYPGRVAATTRQRIAAVSAELGYAPRTQAASQPNGRFFLLLMEELSLFAFPETVYGAILRTLEEKARQQQVGMLLATVEKGQVPHSVRERQAQGAIVLGGCPENDALALELAALHLPLVLVDTYIPGAPITSVLPDNEWGGYLAYQHLVEQGHRRIALIEGPSKYRTLVDRRWGALRAADELKVPILPSYQQPSISSGFAQKGYREMKALLQLAEPPTAVFAVSDRAALGALEAIKEAGLRVPQDIALVGFDDQSNAEQASPSLTSVHYAREQIGALAFDLLLGQIEGSAHAPARHVVPSRLVVRASTCSARS